MGVCSSVVPRAACRTFICRAVRLIVVRCVYLLCSATSIVFFFAALCSFLLLFWCAHVSYRTFICRAVRLFVVRCVYLSCCAVRLIVVRCVYLLCSATSIV